MATQFNETEIVKMGQDFAKLDINNDGVIEIDEIKKGLRSLHKQESEEILELFKQMDTDNSGQINYSEFIAATIEKSLYMKQEKLYQAFKHFDTDNSGKISA